MRRLLWIALVATASAQQINTDVIPATSGLNLGHSNQRWNGFFQNVDILGTCTVNGSPCQTAATSQVAQGILGEFSIYISSSTLGADPNLDDNVSNPGAVTSQVPFFMPQLNFTGIGAWFSTSLGGALPTPGASNGGIGIGPGAIPQINPNNTGWFAIPYITINGTALANTANNANHSDTTPAAPANGINVKWQFSGQNISAAIVGDGNAAHALCGNGVFGACTAGGATALSGLTAATGANSISSGNNPQTWQSSLTTNSTSFLTLSESVAGSATSANILNVTTAAGSTVTPLNVANSLSGTQTLPALTITPTWNTTGIVDAALLVNPTNTASGGGSLLADFQIGGVSKVQIDKNGNVLASNSYGGTGAGTNINFCAGGSDCGSNNTNGQTGSAIYGGSDDNNAGASVKAGPAIYRCGMLTAATPNAAALPGVCQLVEGFVKGSAVANVGDVVCMGTLAFQVTDCSHTGPAANIIGIASSTSNPISVVVEGDALVKVSNTAAIGDFVCWTGVAGTDGVPVDNGTSRCASGQYIGIVIAISGSILQSSGTTTASTAMSTSLPLVQLHIGS